MEFLHKKTTSNFYFLVIIGNPSPTKLLQLHFHLSGCRASSGFLSATPFQQQRTTKSSVDRAKKECGSDNKWMKASFFPIDNMLQQNIQTSPIADYFLKGNIRVITTMPCKPLLDRGFVTPCRRLFFLFWVTLLILYFPAISCGTIFPGMKRCERHQIPRLC